VENSWGTGGLPKVLPLPAKTTVNNKRLGQKKENSYIIKKGGFQ
jgi:hypothetical protein